ncbi:MAG: heavy metal-binding domain-containing protein [Candidatus Thermoplasmatota archaeon]|nr:heavy metal-binding domain-containing protein [Candidatus Thermoplasmatota archaeon]
MAEQYVGLMIFGIVLLLTIVPWLISLIATFLYQPGKRKQLLARETEYAARGDTLTTLKKPFGDKKIKEFSLVSANVVMSPSWVQMWIGSIISIFGGEINVFTKIVDWARREAKQRLREQVSEAGYDAVINVRFETTVMSRTRGGKDRTSGVEILAYGTAIKY